MSECPEGHYGAECKLACECENGAECDHVSGACTCTAGWVGSHCEKSELQTNTSKFKNENIYLNAYYILFSWTSLFFLISTVFIPLMHWGLFFTRETGSLNQSERVNPPIMQSECVSVFKMECFWFPFAHWNTHSSHTVEQLENTQKMFV